MINRFSYPQKVSGSPALIKSFDKIVQSSVFNIIERTQNTPQNKEHTLKRHSLQQTSFKVTSNFGMQARRKQAVEQQSNNLEQDLNHTWSAKNSQYKDFRERLKSVEMSGKSHNWCSISLDKAKQRKLLNQTMKIMSNHIYSANISASIALEAEKANIIRFDNLRNQKLAARSHIPPKQGPFEQQMTLKQRFRARLQQKKVHSSGVLESRRGQGILRTDIKEMSLGELIQAEHKVLSEPTQLLNEHNFKKQLFKLQLKTELNQNKCTDRLSLYCNKLRKMMQCCEIILQSYGCTMAEQQRQFIEGKTDLNSRPKIYNGKSGERAQFYYYLGKGNNHQLIRSMFKKRGWWVETDQVQKAHLVWTQLRHIKVLNKLERHSLSPKEQEQRGQEHQRYSLVSIQRYEKQRRSFYKNIESRPLEIAAEDKAEVLKQPVLLHNHFPCNYLLGNKNTLYLSIRAYCFFAKMDMAAIVPPTYYLIQSDSQSLEAFERVFHQKQDAIWIVKPAQNSNRGKSIVLSTDLEEIKSKLGKQKKIIVQEYLKNIFLYEDRKFDIRTYLLAITINGRLKFFFFDEGYLRTTSYLFTTKNIKDRFVHLTNDAVQQTSELYGKYEEANKISYAQFQRYLAKRYPRQSYEVTTLHNEMRDMCREVVKATYNRLDPDRKKFGFELFGLDFIVTCQFKPILIQVNTNPCLEIPCSNLGRLIPLMLENMFRLSIDPLFRPSIASKMKVESYYLYDTSFLEKNRFQLIFDEKYDREIKWQQHVLSSETLEEPHPAEQEQEANEQTILVISRRQEGELRANDIQQRE